MSKISAMTELTTPAGDDEIEVRDKSDTSQAATGTNKRMTWLTTITKIFASRFAVDAGSTDTYVVTLDPVPAAYVTGEHYRFKANTANTGACTINFNGLGAKAIKKAAGGITTDLADNDIRAGQWVDLVYDGTNMQMQSLLGNAPAAGLGGSTGATDNALLRADGAGGSTVQASAITVDDDGALTVPEIAAPATPAAGKVSLYAKADGNLYQKDDTGTETGLAGAGAGYAGVTTGGTGSLDMAQGTKTADEPFIDGSATWNSGGVTFTSIKVNVTDTASNTASLLMDLQVGGVSKFNVSKHGRLFVGGGTGVNAYALASTGDTDTGIYFGNDDTIRFGMGGLAGYTFSFAEASTPGGVKVPDNQYYRWNNSTKLDCDNNKNGILRIITNGNTGGTIATPPASPGQITSDQNNYTPLNGEAYLQRWSSDASRTVTGFVSWNATGEWKLIINVGSNDIVLAHESASSTAANRFLSSTGANITLGANQAADMFYDNTTQRWRVFKRN